MIRLPDLDTPGLPKPRVPARPPGRYDVDAEWGGPTSLGPAALKRADNLRWGWDVVGADEAEHRLAEWERQEDERFDATVQALQPAEAKGFAEGYASEYFARAKTLKASLPEKMWPAIDEKLSRHEQQLFVKATAAEDNAQANAARQRLDESLQTTVIPAAVAAARLRRDDPDKPVRLADAEALAEKLIDANPALAPHEKEARKAAVAGAIHTAFAEALPDDERRDLDPTAAVESVGARFRRLAGVEAGLNTTGVDPKIEEEADEKPIPINPDGFGREAWLAAVRRHRPDLAKGRSINNILALRADPGLSAEIRDENVAYSARFLIGHGHPATPGNIYLAHVLSLEAAVRLLDADPRRPAAEIDEAVAKEHPALFREEDESRTAGAVIAAAEKAMADTRPVDWRQRLKSVSPDLLEAVAGDAREAAAQTEAAAKLADDSAYQARLEDTQRAIAAGDFGLVDLQKANGEGGWLRDTEDFLRLHGLIAKRAADALDYDKSVEKYTNPNYQFDPASPDDQRAVDLIYERGIVGNDANEEDDATFLWRLVARTGIVPKGSIQSANLEPSLNEDVAKVVTQFNATNDKLSKSDGEGGSAGNIAQPSVEIAQTQIERNDGEIVAETDARPRPQGAEHLVIFVGGADDATSGIVKSYSETYRAVSGGTGREVRYFENDQAPEIVKAIDKAAAEGRRITLIGHSWGGYAILKAASESGKKIDNLVTVDPVGKLSRSPVLRPNSVVNWLNVDADPDKFDGSDVIEWVGKLIGRKIPVGQADKNERITANHRDFAEVMALGGVLDLIEKTEESADLGELDDMRTKNDKPVAPIPIPVRRPIPIDEPPIPRPSPFRPS